MTDRVVLIAVSCSNQELTFKELVQMVARSGEVDVERMRISYIDAELDRIEIASDAELNEALHQPGPLLLIVSGHRPRFTFRFPAFSLGCVTKSLLVGALNGAERVGALLENCADTAYEAVARAWSFTEHMAGTAK